jgi:hypothetical protein
VTLASQPPGPPDPGPDFSGVLPPPVRSLIQQHIGGFEELEALLFLYRRRGQPLSAERLAGEIRAQIEELAPALQKLAAAGLLASESGTYAYPAGVSPADPALEWLSSAQESHRLAILRLMTECAILRMRSSAWSAFADSFRFRGRGRG